MPADDLSGFDPSTIRHGRGRRIGLSHATVADTQVLIAKIARQNATQVRLIEDTT
jgi:hypothetical protein